MIYISNIKIKDNTYPGNNLSQKSFNIDCGDVVLLVGDQGCGKSTLLKMLQQNHKDLKLTFSEEMKGKEVKSFYFDTEKDNPRAKDIQMFSNPNGTDRGIGTKNALLSYLQSHGEVMREFVIEPLLQAKDCVILLDEPESGLSLMNQHKLKEAIKIAVKNGCQLFIATHCIVLIEYLNIYDVENNESLLGVDYISRIKRKF